MAISAAPQATKSKSKIQPISALALKSSAKAVAVLGGAGVGKTYTVIEYIDYLISKGLTPEQIHIEYIDLDAGLVKILEQVPFPEEYVASITYTFCADFYDVQDATTQAYERLAAHKSQHGIDGCAIFVDNMTKAWEYARNDVCQAIYGVSMTVKMKEARASQEKAKRTGSKGKGVFNQSLDYAIINPLHNDWADSFRTCGYNVVWLSPWKYEDIEDDKGNIIETVLRFGQKANDLRMDFIFRKYFDDQKNRRIDFFKSRSTNTLPKGLKNLSWTQVFDEIDKIASIEKREREAAMKTRTFPVPSQKVENPTQECLDAIVEKQADNNDW